LAAHSFGDNPSASADALIPLGRLCLLPTPLATLFLTLIIEGSMAKSKKKVQEISEAQKQHKQRKQRAKMQRLAQQMRQQKLEQEAEQKIMALPVVNQHAAGIDVGDKSHWVCVEKTPDGSNPIREFPAHTPGLRDLVEWLRQCGVTTVALEASRLKVSPGASREEPAPQSERVRLQVREDRETDVGSRSEGGSRGEVAVERERKRAL
jgi:hypothetical protein